MSKIIERDIRPQRHTNGKFTIYEYTYFQERVFAHGVPMYKSRRRLWPEIKMENGRGMVFETAKEAMKYWLEHRGDEPIERGTLLHKRLSRMGLI